jgi:DNA-binding NtrC family response regulator
MTNQYKILVIDNQADSIVANLADSRFAAAACPDSSQVLNLLGRDSYEVVFCSVKLSGTSHMQLMSLVLQHFPEIAFVLVTEHGDLRPGILAMMCGASDCIQAPLRPETIAASIRRALRRKHMERALAEIPNKPANDD